MKNIKLLSLLLLSMFLIVSCDKTQDDLVTENAEVGGLIVVNSKNLNYVVGNGGTYSFSMLLEQNSTADIAKVLVYKSFSGVLGTSEEILSETIDAPGTDYVTLKSKEYSYADLISGLTIDGTDLPSSDGELSIGDQFIFRIVSEMSDGKTFQQAYTVNMTVSTRYAGTYVCSELAYWRIGVQSPSYWLGHELTIKSIDAITYQYDWGATIGWAGPLYFQVDGDGNITYPEEWDGVAQTLNGQPLTTCTRNPGDLANVPCEGSNKVIKDDVNGKDQLVLTYGYYTGGSGPREFHEILIKK